MIIKRKSAGPVFSIVKGTGRGGKAFERLSFRTRGLPADSFLRKPVLRFSPQLVNVFLGNMSFVGVQVARNSEEKTRPTFRYVKPGLVKCQFCRNADVWYSQNWSLWLDIKILVKMLLNKNKIE